MFLVVFLRFFWVYSPFWIPLLFLLHILLTILALLSTFLLTILAILNTPALLPILLNLLALLSTFPLAAIAISTTPAFPRTIPTTLTLLTPYHSSNSFHPGHSVHRDRAFKLIADRVAIPLPREKHSAARNAPAFPIDKEQRATREEQVTNRSVSGSLKGKVAVDKLPPFFYPRTLPRTPSVSSFPSLPPTWQLASHIFRPFSNISASISSVRKWMSKVPVAFHGKRRDKKRRPRLVTLLFFPFLSRRFTFKPTVYTKLMVARFTRRDYRNYTRATTVSRSLSCHRISLASTPHQSKLSNEFLYLLTARFTRCTQSSLVTSLVYTPLLIPVRLMFERRVVEERHGGCSVYFHL